MTWDDLSFWSSQEWSDVQVKLDECSSLCPRRDLLFRALDDTDPDRIRCVIVGQDPYPDPVNACGLAFSIPALVCTFPGTLQSIMREYHEDLHLPVPTSGDLSSWADRGVLLWNAIPSCAEGTSLSHDWPEWRRLTDEIIETMCRKGVCFVLLGRIARRHAETINYYELLHPGENKLITLSHPSPRGNARSRAGEGFRGSRVFSTINSYLGELGYSKIDWRL